jgi:hypothetical protein
MKREKNMNLHSPLYTKVSDELVPSRYALRIGEIDVMVVSDGVLTLPGAMLAHNAEPAVREAWLKDNFLPPDAFDWALNVVVVRSGSRTILIDAGMGAEFPLPRAGQLIHRLEAAGIDLASVTDGSRRRAACRRSEGPTSPGLADPRGSRRGQILGDA